MIALLEQNRQKIQQLCEKHHVRKLSVFGSAAREHDFHEDSDVDFAVEFAKEEISDYLDTYLTMAEGLEAILGRKVDMTTNDVSKLRNPYIRQSIMEDLRIFYQRQPNDNYVLT